MKALVVGDVIDDILVTPTTVIRNNTDTHASIQKSAGGSGANFACWLGSISKKTDSVHTDTVHFVGRVHQMDAQRHTKVLEHFNVIPMLQQDPILLTGSIVVLVEGNNRSFLTDRGANKNLELNQIPDASFGELLYLSGYSLLSLGEKEIKALITKAHQLGAKVAVDPGSAGFIQDFGIKRFLDAMKDADILLPNLEEGRVLTGEDRPELIAGFLVERFNTVALTMGSEGCLVQKVKEAPIQLEALKADVLDPTGAGDAFAAAFLKELLASNDLQAAAKAGMRLGAIAVTLPGGRPKA